MDYGTLRVTTPDGQVREYPIDVPSVIIGRAEGNRVVIDHVSVSRRHARLTVDSGRAVLEDLGSATGTFVGSQRVEPNTQHLLNPGQTIRIGDVEAVLLGFGPPQHQSLGASPDYSAPPSRAEQQTISLALTSPTAPINPGAATTATLVIQNRGPVVDEVVITVPDLPSTWVRVTRPNLNLVPGARDEVSIVIQPPRGPEAPAGEYQIAVAVFSRQHGVEVRALGRFTLLPFEDLAMAMRPNRARRNFTCSVENRGNQPLEVHLSGADPEAALRFRFNPAAALLQPGEERRVPLAVTAAKGRMLGPTLTKPFRVAAQPATGAKAVEAEGQVVLKPPLQVWLWPIIALVVLAGLGAGGWYYDSNCGDNGWPLCRHDDTSPASPATATSAVPLRATAAPTTPAPAASVTSAPVTVTTGPTAAGLRPGGNARVVNSDPNPPTNCLGIRSSPMVVPGDTNLLRRICTDKIVKVVNGPTNDGVRLWWLIDDGAGQGWAAERRVNNTDIFLVPAP